MVEAGAPSPAQRSDSPRSPRGPAASAAAAGAGAARLFCPVPGCLHADPRQSRGWVSQETLRAHVDAHLSGHLQGDVPDDWFRAERRQRCEVCGLSVSVRFGVHPTGRAQTRGAPAASSTQQSQPSMPLPELSAIASSRSSVLRHVPPQAKGAWCQVLTRALAAAVHFNTVAAWTELLMLPQAVLAAPPRTGRKHRKATAAFTLDRLRRWQEGERSSLWDTRTSLARPPWGALTDEVRAGLAESLAREGFDRKACAALLASGLCAETPEAADQLRALHPAAATPAAPPHLPPAGEVVPDTVSRCLKAFPKDSAPGPFGLRVQHLLDACLPGSSAGLLEQLTALVNGVTLVGPSPPSLLELAS